MRRMVVFPAFRTFCWHLPFPYIGPFTSFIMIRLFFEPCIVLSQTFIANIHDIQPIFLRELMENNRINFNGLNILAAHQKTHILKPFKTSVYKGYKQDKIEMRGDRAEMSDFPLYLNTVAGGLDRRDQTIGGFSFVVKIYAVPVVEIIG